MRFYGPAADLLGRDDLLRAVFLEGASKGQQAAGGAKPAKRKAAAR
ncbi:MAG: hypothetical protein JWO22_2872 [Frankiales bacterium]|nr:hypothetical protein [Frankiales bacterium]